MSSFAFSGRQSKSVYSLLWRRQQEIAAISFSRKIVKCYAWPQTRSEIAKLSALYNQFLRSVVKTALIVTLWILATIIAFFEPQEQEIQNHKQIIVPDNRNNIS